MWRWIVCLLFRCHCEHDNGGVTVKLFKRSGCRQATAEYGSPRQCCRCGHVNYYRMKGRRVYNFRVK